MNNLFISCLFAALIGLCIDSRVYAATGVEIGPGFQVLTQLQGSWRNQCRRAGVKLQEGYRQDFLSVTFTHFDFIAKIYSDEACQKLLTQWPSKYRFSLGDLVKLPNQETAFMLRFVEELDPADAWNLSQNNLVQYQAGRLTLGREPFAGSDSSQLTSLNLELFFTRR